MDDIYFEFVKVPKKLIYSLEESYKKKKEDIINILKEDLFKEYGIDIRDSGREQVQQSDK